MKKAIITIIVGLLLVGCNNQETSRIEEVTIANKSTEKNESVIKDTKENTKENKNLKESKDINYSHENKIYWYQGKENSIDHDYKIELEELCKSQKYSDDDYKTLNQNHYNTWDNELNAIYNKLLNVLNKEEKALLIKSQKGWLQLHIYEPKLINRTFRERNSGSIFGEAALEQIKNRQLDWIRRRTLQLINYNNYLGYSYDFEYKSKYPDIPKMEEKVSEERKKHEIYVNFDISGSYEEISYNNAISKDYKVELEKLQSSRNYSTSNVLELQGEFNNIWDKELNIVYNKLLNKLEKEEKELLKKAQIGWVQHHMNEGEFFAKTIMRRLGSLGRFEYMDEDMERLKRRTLELMEYCYYLGEDFNFTYENKKETINKIYSQNKEITFVDRGLEERVRIALLKPEGSIFKEDLEKVENFEIKDDKVKNLDGIEQLSNIKHFSISSSNIDEIESLDKLNELSKLETLKITNCNLKTLNAIKDITNVERLVLRSNSIDDLSGMQNFSKLKTLQLSYNKIRDIKEIGKLSNLEVLAIDYNGVNDIQVLRNLKKLKHLYMSGNEIEDISALEKLTELELLRVEDNLINDISYLKNCTKLKNLSIGKNQIKDYSCISKFVELEELKINSGQLSNVEFLKDLIELKYLHLTSNKIKDITPMAKLSKIEILFLDSNEIENIQVLSNKTELRKLDLSCNNVKDIEPLVGLDRLGELYVFGNQVDKKKLEDLNVVYIDVLDTKDY